MTSGTQPAHPLIQIVIPTCRGGVLLRRVVREVLGQQTSRPFTLTLVDSGSSASEVESLRALGATVHSIAPDAFDHGRTRDVGVALGHGEVLVFLNQDALPVDEFWLETLTAPFWSGDPPAAAQGGIREFPRQRLAEVGRRRFFWDSCGPRFYFTRESGSWIERHGGIGFSTVNCAIARRAWEQVPLGPAAMLEDKLWQRRASERGWRIDAIPEAAVWHTHDYDLAALMRRCVSEGYGWRLVGERYGLATAIGDLGNRTVWRELRRGVRAGEARRAVERLFPLLRPLALWWGNRWARGVRP